MMDSKLVTAQGGRSIPEVSSTTSANLNEVEMSAGPAGETTDAFFSGSKFGSVMKQLGSCGSSFKKTEDWMTEFLSHSVTAGLRRF
ncbi:unnamed protein product [Arctogadus glacialis]